MNDANEFDTKGDVFVADPADAEYFDEPMLPKWPIVVGTISIVLGALLTLCAAALPAQGALNSSLMGGMEGGAPDVLLDPPSIIYVIAAFSLISSLTLLTAGIMCVLRKPVARKLHIAYGILGLIGYVWGVMIQLDNQKAVDEWVQQNPDSQFAEMQRMQGGSTMGLAIGLGCGAILGLPWPGFSLFWFGFVKTKPEDFTGGANLDII